MYKEVNKGKTFNLKSKTYIVWNFLIDNKQQIFLKTDGHFSHF